MSSSLYAQYDAHNSVFNTSTQHAVENYIVCGGVLAKPCINVGPVGNMVYEKDTWVAYKRNYFAMECSFSLPPCNENMGLYMGRNMSKVLSFGVTLSSFSDRKKNIELLRFTPKRDVGSAHSVGMHKILPTSADSMLWSPETNIAEDKPNNMFHLTNINKCLCESTNVIATSHYFERIQFKNSSFKRTASKAVDETYRLSVDLYAQVQQGKDSEPKWIKIAWKVSEPIIVRGKSPKNFRGR